MDNRSVPVVGIMTDVEFQFPACLDTSYKTNITVVQVRPNYRMSLSRQWPNLVGGHVQLDLSYATIPVKGVNVRINREPRSFYLIEEVDPNETTCFLQTDIDNFQVSISKPIQCKNNKF